jgi:fatty acid-binding protein DegV
LAVKIITDSTAYIPQEIRKELCISMVSLSVSFESETYREEDIDDDSFYKKMAQAREIPSSCSMKGRMFSFFRVSPAAYMCPPKLSSKPLQASIAWKRS